MLKFFILGLATWRVTSILIEEKIAEPLRKVLGYDGLAYPDTFFGYLISCFKCLSVWVAAGLLVLYAYLPEIPQIFAVSALAVIIWEKIVWPSPAPPP